jgi:hypothetical protein
MPKARFSQPFHTHPPLMGEIRGKAAIEVRGRGWKSQPPLW